MTLTWEQGGWIVENRGILGNQTATTYRASCMKNKGKEQHPPVHVVKKTSLDSYCSYTMNVVSAVFPRAGKWRGAPSKTASATGVVMSCLAKCIEQVTSLLVIFAARWFKAPDSFLKWWWSCYSLNIKVILHVEFWILTFITWGQRMHRKQKKRLHASCDPLLLF